MALRISSRLRELPSFCFHSACAVMGSWPRASCLPDDWRSLPVFCVTTEKAHQRRQLIEKQNCRLGFRRLEFIFAPDLSGQDPDHLDELGLYDDCLAREFHDRPLRKAEISCSLAHGLIYERIVRDEIQRALVIEDDALFIGKKFKKLRLDSLPEGWELLMINAERSPKRPKDQFDDALCGVESYRASSCAYLVSQVAAKKMAESYKPVIHAADGFLGRSMPPSQDGNQGFKGVGSRIKLNSYMTIEDYVLNGSCCHYYNSSIRGLSNRHIGKWISGQ